MKVKEIMNTKTGLSFEYPCQELISYAKQEPSVFRFTYDEEAEPEAKKNTYTQKELKSMSMKDLQTLAMAFELECDKRDKDKLIDAILVTHGR